MLTITIPEIEIYDPIKEEFVKIKKQTLSLEHSLVSISKWESKWNKPFLSSEDKTTEETLDYIRCMTLTQNVDPLVYTRLTKENVDAINEYIDAPMTATTFASENKTSKKEIITAEIIYYWMISFGIPFDCQKWHLNKLLTLIKVCSIKEAPSKKMSKRKTMTNNAALNAARRKALGTRG